MRVGMIVRVAMAMTRCFGPAVVVVSVCQVNIEFDPGNGALMRSGKMKVVSLHLQFGQPLFELGRVDAKVDQRADKHIPADPTEQIQKERFHLVGIYSPAARELIWLAA